jgi:hypothetical protein
VNISFQSFFAGLLFGAIGMFLIGRARREGHLPSLVLGIGLIIYPYFVENTYLLWGTGIALAALAYQMRD